jgi:PAS domain S-box-containing protein
MKLAHKISLSFFSTAAICGLSVFILVYFIVADNLTKSIFANLEAVAHDRTNHIETYLKMLKISVGQLSKSTALEALLKTNSKDDPERGKAFEVATKRLKRTKEVNSSVASFLLMDKDGKVVASSQDSDVGLDKATDAFFTGGRKEIYIKDAYYSGSDTRPLIAVSAPCLDSNTGEFLGVLAARIQMNELNNIVTDKTGLGNTGEIYIVNKYGYMITPSRFLNDTFLKQKVETEGVRRVRLHTVREHPFSKKEMLNVYSDYRGVPVLGAHEYLPQMRWGVIAEMEKTEAFAPLEKLRQIFFLGLLMTVVMAGELGIFLAKVITRPLYRLQTGIEIIGRGNLDYKVGVSSNDEIGQLSRAFDAMTENLRNKTISVEMLNKEISERKKVEEDLRKNEGKYRILFESSSDALMTLSPFTGRFLSANHAMAEMFRFRNVDEILSLGPWDLSPERQPDGRLSSEKAREMIATALREGSLFFEWTHKRVDGEEFPATVLLTRLDMVTEVFFLATVRDITQQRQDEQRFIESQRTLKEQAEQLDAALKEALRSREVLESMLDDNNAARDNLMKANQDLNNMQDKLVRSEKMASIGQLAAGVAHEINNPVGFISSNLEVMTGYVEAYLKVLGLLGKVEASAKRKAWEEVEAAMAEIERLKESVNFAYMVEDSRRLIEQSRGGMERIEKIVSDLKTFAREETQWLEDPVKIEDVLEAALGITQNELKYCTELRKKYGDTPQVRCNAQKMGQVFVNLLVNAAQAIPEKGIIEIRTYEKGGHVCVDISDTGCGIPPENLARVFDPFFTTKPAGKGIGLGLSISYEIVRKQRGEIGVVSEVGKGTTFTVMIPLPLVKVDKKT